MNFREENHEKRSNANIAVLFAENADHGTFPALITAGRSWTYKELRDNGRRFGGALQSLGLQPGDYVYLKLPNRGELWSAYYGVMSAGCVAVLAFPGLTPAEMQAQLDLFKPACIVTDQQTLAADDTLVGRVNIVVSVDAASKEVFSFASLIASANPIEPVHRSPVDVALVSFTSGSSGRPSPIPRTHDSLDGPIPIHPPGVVLQYLPALRGGIELTAFFLSKEKTTMVYRPSFNALECLQDIEQHKVTVMFLTVPMLTSLAQYAASHDLGSCDLSSLQCAWTSGSPLDDKVAKQCKERLGFRPLSIYGISECGPIAMQRPHSKFGSVGFIHGNLNVKLVNDKGQTCATDELGELWVKDHPFSGTGYFNDSKKTNSKWSEDGWYRSGDVCSLDKDHELFVWGRMEDTIVLSSGERIFPLKLEAVLLALPQVVSCAVMEIKGQVVAFVVVSEYVPESALFEQCNLNKITLNRIVFLNALPLNHFGKVNKNMLLQMDTTESKFKR